MKSASGMAGWQSPSGVFKDCSLCFLALLYLTHGWILEPKHYQSSVSPSRWESPWQSQSLTSPWSNHSRKSFLQTAPERKVEKRTLIGSPCPNDWVRKDSSLLIGQALHAEVSHGMAGKRFLLSKRAVSRHSLKQGMLQKRDNFTNTNCRCWLPRPANGVVGISLRAHSWVGPGSSRLLLPYL